MALAGISGESAGALTESIRYRFVLVITSWEAETCLFESTSSQHDPFRARPERSTQSSWERSSESPLFSANLDTGEGFQSKKTLKNPSVHFWRGLFLDQGLFSLIFLRDCPKLGERWGAPKLPPKNEHSQLSP